MPARINIKTGDLIPNTRLTYLEERPQIGKRRQALFSCFCGNEFETDLHWVRFLDITSCGCYKSELLVEKNTKHLNAERNNLSGAYRSWQAMNQRVKVNPLYQDVKICDRWQGHSGFTNFLEDMGERPDKQSIERKENKGDYEPNNCKWATQLEQAQNTTLTKLVTMGEETLSINAWCRKIGIGYSLYKQRRKRGMSIEDSLLIPVDKSKQGRKKK